MKALCKAALLMIAIGALGVGIGAAAAHGGPSSHAGEVTGTIQRDVVSAGISGVPGNTRALLPSLAVIAVAALAAGLAVCFFIRSRRSRIREGQREELYRNLFYSSRDTIVIADLDRRILDANQPALRDTFGYDTAELVGRTTHCLYATEGEYQRAGYEVYNRQGAEEEATLEVRFRTRHGETFPGTLRARKLRNRKGEVVGNIGMIHDITEEKRQEEQLADSQDRLEKSYLRSKWLAEVGRQVLGGQEIHEVIRATVREIAAHFPHLRTTYSVIEKGGRIRVLSSIGPPGSPALDGVTFDISHISAVGRTLRQGSPVIVPDAPAQPELGPVSEELRDYAIVAILAAPLIHSKDLLGFLSFDTPYHRSWNDHEIDTLKEMADFMALALSHNDMHRRIQEDLEENRTLLKEVHHRVKNNLNVVASLLALQADEIETVDQARQAFRNSRNRIHSMAQVHESLYQSPELSHVDMEAYFDRFLPQLLHAFDKAGEVEIRTIVDEVQLPVTEAVPCGIIVNELVSNALKHAFPDGRGGSILVRLQRAESDRVVLAVEDDGVGLAELPDLQGGRTLGLNLTRLLAEQLGGTFEYTKEEHTLFSVTFRPGA